MVGQVFLNARKNRKAFHQTAKVGMVQHWKEGRTSIIPVLLYQVKGFGQQLDTGTKLVFLAAVFEPQTAAVIRKQVIPCNGNGVGISCSGLAGKEEEVSCQDVGGAIFGNDQVTDSLEGFPA